MKREGTKNVLNYSRRTAKRKSGLTLREMVHNGDRFYGDVKSKGKFPLNEGYYEFTIKEPPEKRDINIGYPGSTVNTPDKYWSDGKKKNVTVVVTHLTVPEIALFNDQMFGLNQDSNITGLSPKERSTGLPLPEPPFTFNRFTKNYKRNLAALDFNQLITDLIMEYYIDGITQYEMSVRIANEPRLFGAELLKAIRHPGDRGRFQVLRQMEKQIEPEDSIEDRHYASARALMGRIERVILESRSGYHFTGYMREFPSKDPKNSYESISKRFEPAGRGPVYSLFIFEGIPIIVKRDLGHKVDDLMSNDGAEQETHPFKRLGRRYSSIDDVTRREATTEIILPDTRLIGQNILVAQNLRDIYDKVRKGEFN